MGTLAAADVRRKVIAEVRDDRGRLLLEDVHWLVPVLVEDKQRPGIIVARGEFARADSPTENKRMYGQHLFEREITKLQESVEGRRQYGELDHPSDGKIALQRTSHLITELKLAPDGRVLGALEVLDTSQGLNLQAILKQGGRVGISSRGFGSVSTDPSGNQVVQDDYNLVTFDVVANPADARAYPHFYAQESKGGGLMENADGTAVSVDPEKEKEREAEIKRVVADALETLRGEMKEQAIAEVRSDPRIAGSVAALEQIAALVTPHILPEDVRKLVDSKDRELEKLRADLVQARRSLGEAEEMAKKFGYRMYLDNLVQNESASDQSLIRKLVGALEQFSNKDEIAAKVAAVKESIASEKKPREEAVKAELQAFESKLRKLREETDRELSKIRKESADREKTLQAQLKEAQEAQTVKQRELEEALTAAKGFGLKALVEQVTSRHPQGPRLKKMFEEGKIQSASELYTIADELKSQTSDEFTRVSERVRQATGRGVQALDEDARGGRSSMGSVLGTPIEDIARLSGVPGRNGSR